SRRPELGRLPGPEGAVGADVDPQLPEALADEVLERRPGAAWHVEQPVDLPLGEEPWIVAPRVCPVGHLRKPSELLRQRGPLPARAVEPLLPDRKVEPGLAKRVRQRAERVGIEGCRGERTAARGEVACRRGASELLAEAPELREEVVTGEKAAREKP